MGGVLAYEAARRLKEDGESVEMLVIVDTPVPRPENEPKPSAIWRNGIRRLAERLGIDDVDVSWIIEQDPDIQIRQLLTRAQEAGAFPADYDQARVTHMLQTRTINRLAGARYRPPAYRGDVMFIRGIETINRLAASPGDNDAGTSKNWENLVDRVITYDHRVPHLEMLSAENAGLVANIVTEFLTASS